ncbi:hypothetical protein PYCCODRAFT_1425606 [Trametes coccinea BRFM310]|uniref:Uncharacterized protein n=1 Tax=Trametes coccinea (strain BRFM310) TaxID=1353009 RepID=A0A1Y2IL89_TRAC3|nr:hypothetical protein PYCCODRAFT_1425606 [Trametes coccinea BRFM310]
MSSNPRNYNAEDHVRWERYANAFRTWLAKRGPYPGEPPEGYLEVYKVTQRLQLRLRPHQATTAGRRVHTTALAVEALARTAPVMGVADTTTKGTVLFSSALKHMPRSTVVPLVDVRNVAAGGRDVTVAKNMESHLPVMFKPLCLIQDESEEIQQQVDDGQQQAQPDGPANEDAEHDDLFDENPMAVDYGSDFEDALRN